MSQDMRYAGCGRVGASSISLYENRPDANYVLHMTTWVSAGETVAQEFVFGFWEIDLLTKLFDGLECYTRDRRTALLAEMAAAEPDECPCCGHTGETEP